MAAPDFLKIKSPIAPFTITKKTIIKAFEVTPTQSSANTFISACRRQQTSHTPVWLMRQAGRYQPEYRELRSKVGFLELCHTPELAAKVTIDAANWLDTDAAILFADILLILEPMGFDLEFVKGDGPAIHNPVRSSSDVDRVRDAETTEPLSYVYEAVKLIRRDLPKERDLIGFAGAPFTLACYAIEGGGSRHYDKAKTFMYQHPESFKILMQKLTEATIGYLNAQIEAGADVVQLFDSWVGNLSHRDYVAHVQPHMKRLFEGLKPGVPSIHFGTGTGHLLEAQRDAGGDVIGLDWRADLDESWAMLGDKVAVQGNLDPILLLSPWSEIERQTKIILDQAANRPGHIFNLGHGILPSTPPDNVRRLVDFVHEYSRR
jgi:uroporphyrinogen decarboxylase